MRQSNAAASPDYSDNNFTQSANIQRIASRSGGTLGRILKLDVDRPIDQEGSNETRIHRDGTGVRRHTHHYIDLGRQTRKLRTWSIPVWTVPDGELQ
jgi:hypothetical protein